MKYAFNELLEFWAENGLIGVILVCISLVSIFSVPNGDRILISSKASLIAVISFSFFSYPLSILPIKLIIVLTLAIIASYQQQNWKYDIERLFVSRVARAIWCCLILIAIISHVIYVDRLRKSYVLWKEANTQYRLENYSAAAEKYRKSFKILKSNGVFLAGYGKTLHMLGRDRDAISILTLAELQENSILTQLTLGESYLRLGEYKLAEKAYLKAHYMIPARTYPQYLLVKLYVAKGDSIKALALAKKLTVKKEKIDSDASMEMKTELKDIINNYEK